MSARCLFTGGEKSTDCMQLACAETAGLEEEDLKLNVEETIRRLTNLKCEEGPVSRQEFADVIDLAVAALKRMERQEQDRWIPIAEKLPEPYKTVIVTDVETIDTYTCEYHGGGYWNTDTGDAKNRIIAWRPLPEPYQEEES